MDQSQKDNIYGGWNWALIAPFILQAVAQTVASIKMMLSENGSVKTSGYESHWDNRSTGSTKQTANTEIKQTNLYYAY